MWVFKPTPSWKVTREVEKRKEEFAMSNSKNNVQKKGNTVRKEEKDMSKKKYYQAYPSYDDSKKIKGLVMDIEGTKYYIDLKDPVVTEIKRGTKVLFAKKTFNVSVLPTQKKRSKVNNAL